jgi:hypothetical protein
MYLPIQEGRIDTAESTARLTNGQRWTKEQFLDHFFEPTASGTPTPVAGPPAPVDVDRSWYMDEGPGRYYHPGMFPIIHQIIRTRNLAPGTYDLRDFVSSHDEKDPLLTAGISNYTTDVPSDDHRLRAFVFGNESGRISGQVVANPDGSKTFRRIEIRPVDTDFNFNDKGGPKLLEFARALGRSYYDPEKLGSSYDIQYRGPGPNRGVGRIYDPFTDLQLNAALADPRGAPPGLLPSITGKPPLPLVDEHRQYLDQANGNNSQASTPIAGTPTVGFDPANRNSSGRAIGDWVASLAGVAPLNPTQSAPPPLDDGLHDFYRDDPAWFLQLRR